ncbi:MAG: DegV family protein [Oscillospiraceae bacterium]|jgi:DegV family protein with EDD domain|nr:DegV family protein [Oscillospiraceae bacterium]
MGEYILSCCTTADISREHFEKRNISYICFHYSLNGRVYPDDLGQTMSIDDFYKEMEKGADTSTSQVNVNEYEEYFGRFLEQGKDILHVTLSSGISGTYNSAEIAAAQMREKYPGRKIIIVDSLAASSGFGLLMDELADRRDGGESMEDTAEWARTHRLLLNHWFFSTDLSYYIKGGRISKIPGMIGTVLNICPVLDVDKDGRLQPRYKVRGKQRAIRRIEELMEENAEDGLEYSGKCFISQSACFEDARKLADLIESRFRRLKGKVLINHIGTTIGSHTGPGTVALFFWGRAARA